MVEYNPKQDLLTQFARELGECLYVMRVTQGWTLDEIYEKNNRRLAIYQIEWAERGYGQLLALEDLVLLAACYNKKLRVMFE